MNLAQLFRSYELLVNKVDSTFHKIRKEHGDCIKCERHCADCCHAVFGLFLIEAAYINQHFNELDSEEMREALMRCSDTERAFKRLEIKLQNYEDDPQMQVLVMAKERIRCPLLDDNQDCILYNYRPITCRAYGVPTKIHGKARVCGKAKFKKGRSYPVFDLDGAYRDLYIMSKEFLKNAEKEDPEKASLMISVSKGISTPPDDLIHVTFE